MGLIISNLGTIKKSQVSVLSVLSDAADVHRDKVELQHVFEQPDSYEFWVLKCFVMFYFSYLGNAGLGEEVAWFHLYSNQFN